MNYPRLFLVLLISVFVSFVLHVHAKDVAQHAFAAEVTKMMDIIIHSLYKSKEIFLRELIANASDALDKLRQVGLTKKEFVEDWPLDIKIRADPEKGILVIRDTGIGMSKEEMITNLGTIARSGTKEFIEKFSEKSDSQQIGQFGVGFYSSFLAGNVVQVISKSFGGEKHVWECDIRQGAFTIKECPAELDSEDPITTQGTKIIIHLKKDDEDAIDYTSEETLKDLIHRYSEFINFPIYLFTRKSMTEQVPLSEEELAEQAAKGAEEKKAAEGDEVNVEDAEEEKKKSDSEKPKTKSVTKTTEEYVLVNNNKPIWTRDPADVTAEEYIQFYKNFTKDTKEPHDYSHFRVEGSTTDFRGLIYIPKTPSFQLLSNDSPVDFLKLFVKRVFISSEFPDFPRYLSFVKALVDADDIPLNVSRETLQKTKIVQDIKKSVISKTLSLLNKMAKNETSYAEFYKTYANHLKLGVISETEDSRKKDLAGLLRFHTSNTGLKGAMTSFDDYIGRMKDNQTDIYFVSGTDVSSLKRLPYVEALLKRDLEVLFMVDTYDEYAVQALPQYREKTLKNVAKGGIKFADETEEDKKRMEDTTARFKVLTDYLQKLFSKRIEKVVISNLLDKSPVAIVANTFGFSPAMEKLMASNSGPADPMAAFFGKQKKVMEINPEHPLMEGLLQRLAKESAPSKEFEADIRLLYDAALLHSGYELKNPAAFAHRVEDMIRNKYGVEPLSDEAKKEMEAEEEAQAANDSFPDFGNMDFGNMGSGAGGNMDFGAGGDNFDMPDDFRFSDDSAHSHSAEPEQATETNERDEL